VLFCVKLWDIESAGQQIKPLIGPDKEVIPLQNGVDAAERLVSEADAQLDLCDAEALHHGFAYLSNLLSPSTKARNR
jgi:ketopantoate reductase